MNRIVLLSFLLSISIHIRGQFSDVDIVSVKGLNLGLEKNSSIIADYSFGNGIHVNVKHTAIADELSRQSWRVSASYNADLRYVQATGTPFITSDWKTSFYNLGFSLKLRNLWRDDNFKIGAEYVPYYDNELKFQNGWAIGAELRLYKHISLFAEYGRRPDYRIAYERMYLGFDISVMNLCVKPMIEIPSYDSGIRWTHSKIVVSMYYTFGQQDHNQ